MTERKVKIDRYVISAYEAGELLEAYGNEATVLEAAIDIARERARLYCIPANWVATFQDDGSILVKRYRND